MLEISQAYGWTLPQLMQNMTARELFVRVTHLMVQKGYTFQPDKIAEIQKQQEQGRKAQAHERALGLARAHWSGQSK